MESPNVPRASKRSLLEIYLRARQPQAASGEPLPTIPHRVSGGIAPLALEQVPLWRFSQLMPGIPAHCKCVTIHLPGPLDVSVLKRSFSEIIRRHEAWRTTFSAVDGHPVQVVHPAAECQVPMVDLRAVAHTKRWNEAIRVAREDFRIPFDLERGPLLRARLVRLDESEHLLFLSMHYMIFDGVSLYHVFLPELRALYEAFSLKRPSPLPPLPVQYADYACWQREVLGKEALANQLAYWSHQLADAPAPLALPTDFSRSAGRSYRGAMRPFALPKQVSDAVRALARQQGVTLYVTLLAAFYTLLFAYTGQEDLLISTRTGSRKRPELAGLLGYFVSTPVIRTSLAGNPEFLELLRRVREATVDTLVHDEVPFGCLVDDLRSAQNLDEHLFGQVAMTFEPSLPALACGWTLTQLDVDIEALEADLYLELDDRPQGIIGCFEYRSDLFAAPTISRMAENWQTLLEDVVADPSQRLSQLSHRMLARPRQVGLT